MEELVTVKTITDFLEDCVKNKRQLSPHVFLDAALKLSILIGEETDKLYELQQQVAELKVLLIEDKQSVAAAKVKVEASDVYKQMKKQEAYIERINELIKISKVRARLKADEMFNQM